MGLRSASSKLPLEPPSSHWLTSATGTAGDRPWAELSQLDAGSWHSRHYAGEPMPSLQAIAAFVLKNDFLLNIEIKPTPGHEADTGRVVAAAGGRMAARPKPARPRPARKLRRSP